MAAFKRSYSKYIKCLVYFDKIFLVELSLDVKGMKYEIKHIFVQQKVTSPVCNFFRFSFMILLHQNNLVFLP